MSDEIKFEKALEKLEKIVEELENGNVALEEALKKYEEGVKLSRLCQTRLAQAEKKVRILNRSLDGSLKSEPFEFEDSSLNGGQSEPASKMKTKDKNTGAAEEDLLF